MSAYFAERALLPTGWASHVRIEVASDGHVTRIEPGAGAGRVETDALCALARASAASASAWRIRASALAWVIT